MNVFDTLFSNLFDWRRYGRGRLRRGEKVYLAKKRELTGQLTVLSEEMLADLAKSWRARPVAGDDKKALIVKLLQQTP